MVYKMKNRIIFFHLLNDYSGSPHVLSLVVKGFAERGYSIDLFTSSTSDGFLSDIKGITYHEIYYKFSKNKILTFILFVIVQIRIFFAVIRYVFNRNTIVYVNTILPFGAALGAVFTRKKLIYHVHEKPVVVNALYIVAMCVFRLCAHKTIFVSKYLYDQYQITSKKYLIYNSLSPEFYSKAKQHSVILNEPFTVLMVCSLKVYKGINEFKELAKYLPQYNFTLILNSSKEEVFAFYRRVEVPKNMEILSTQTDLHPFYEKANLVLNLSRPDLWVETFGLTALEAMAYGIPVIVPPVGGIAEIIESGIQGYKVDSRDLNLLIDRINQTFGDLRTYMDMSNNAKEKSLSFAYIKMIDEIENVIEAN